MRADQTNGDARQLLSQKLLHFLGASCERVLFVNPLETPEEEFSYDLAVNRRYPCFPPYGCGVLARHLQLRGYQTEIVDLNFELLSHVHNAENETAVHYAIWKDVLLQKLDRFAPDVVGISCMFTMAHESMKKVAAAIKEYDDKLPVIVGGVHVTNATEMVLRDCPSVDFAIKHESERSLGDALDFVNGRLEIDRLAQVAALVDGRYFEISGWSAPANGDLDIAPDYHGLQIGQYDSMGQIGAYTFMRPNRKAATVLTNRGCRARCSFCSVRYFNGSGVRGRDVVAVVDEIEALVSKYDVKHIMWLDDDLFYNQRRTVGLFNEIVRRNSDITWDASNGVIAAAITPEIMQSAVESGCIGLTLGIESGNPEILRAVHKPGTLDAFRRAKKILDDYPQVFVKGFLMIGFPHETLAKILDTVSFAMELALDWYPIQILTPLPSTEIYKTMIEAGLIEDDLQAGNAAYQVGAHGKLKLREEREKLSAEEFFNLLTGDDPNHIPSPTELRDYWFLVDYKVNYEKILKIDNPVRLRNIARMLNDICDRVTKENALGNLFLGIIENRLGRAEESIRRIGLAEQYLHQSAYWRKRFDTLQLNTLLQQYGGANKRKTHGTPTNESVP